MDSARWRLRTSRIALASAALRVGDTRFANAARTLHNITPLGVSNQVVLNRVQHIERCLAVNLPGEDVGLDEGVVFEFRHLYWRESTEGGLYNVAAGTVEVGRSWHAIMRQP